MSKNTLVCMTAGESYISIWTVSRSGKSPHQFYILRNSLDELERRSKITVSDINSFAILRRDSNAGIIEIRFTWLSSDGHKVSGHEETVAVPYDKFAAFVHDSAAENGPKEWKALSIDNSRNRPKIVFNGRKNLRVA